MRRLDFYVQATNSTGIKKDSLGHNNKATIHLKNCLV